MLWLLSAVNRESGGGGSGGGGGGHDQGPSRFKEGDDLFGLSFVY
jgi:hypothetical protein